MKRKKNIVVLGSTGSVGENALRVAAHLSDEIAIVGVAAGSNVPRLAEQALEFGCRYASVCDETRYGELKSAVPAGCWASSGIAGMVEMVSAPEVDLVFCSIVGTAGLLPVVEAIGKGKQIALASKEIMVMAGEIVMAEARKHGVRIIPVDSEHSAIFQCLDGKRPEHVSRLILTASGGPFKGRGVEELRRVTYRSALEHPTWSMGPKITVDSATMMNKAFEIIEAKWLFDAAPERIEVLIHPQSVVHSMVEFVDGTILAQMSEPDMRFPIQYALTFPEKRRGCLRPLDFAKFAKLSFESPDRKIFPSIGFAYEALGRSGTMPAVMNAANEVAVEKFRLGQISFTQIWTLIERTMSSHGNSGAGDLAAVLEADSWARRQATEIAI